MAVDAKLSVTIIIVTAAKVIIRIMVSVYGDLAVCRRQEVGRNISPTVPCHP